MYAYGKVQERELSLIKKLQNSSRLAPGWQYFGTITCDGLHGIMKLYIDKP